MYCSICEQDHEGTACLMRDDEDMPIYDEAMIVINELKADLVEKEETCSWLQKECDGACEALEERNAAFIKLEGEIAQLRRVFSEKVKNLEEELQRARNSEIAWLEAYQKKVKELNTENAALKHDNEVMAKLNDSFPLEIVKLEDENIKLKAERERLRSIIDGAKEVVEIFDASMPAQIKWRNEWLKQAAEVLEGRHE